MNNQQTKPPYRCYIATEKKIHFPGDTVRCIAELSFDRKFNCEEIIAIWTGEARVYWIDKQVSETSLCRHLAFYQKRRLFEQQKSIWKADLIDVRKKKSTLTDIVRFSSPNSIRTANLLSGEEKPEFRGFEAGNHKLPVDFVVPEEGIHSSLEVHEELVSIRYQIEIQCLVDGRITKKFHQLLNVSSPRDLSEEMDKLGRTASSEKILQSKIGKLSAILTLPKTGYTPGEPLNAQVIVHNMTTNSVKFASVSIMKKIAAIADQPRFEIKEKEDETAGSILPFHKINRGEKKTWMAQIYVPALTPNLCIEDFIHVNYEAKLSIGYERGKMKSTVLHIKIPIKIGTVAIEPSLLAANPEKVPVNEEESAAAESQLKHRMAVLNIMPRTGLPSAPPMYDEVMGLSPAYSALDDEPVPYSKYQKQ